MSRATALAALADAPFDLLVIGGGIVGAGVARDAAMRGLTVALVEREDFASGTSSRSSRLVHGGVRYLEHGHLHLVFESSRERRTLLRIAPHLVRPLEFTWPVYQGARISRFRLGAGLALYDALSLFRNVGRHRRLHREAVIEREPALRAAGLTGGAIYFDASTDDTRLTLANVISARRAGAVVLNHCEVTGLLHAGGRVLGAALYDRVGATPLSVRARLVLNAAGPWTDTVRALDEPVTAAAVRGTRGAHIAVPRARLGNRGAITMISSLDGRVMFALPAGDFAIVGTTDTPTDQSPDDVRATAADVDYLLASANAYFPRAGLTPADVVSAWAGIRPLAASGFGSDAASASREHHIARSSSGLLTVTGGKLTTYRAMAEELVDGVVASLGVTLAPCRTAREPLAGGALASIDEETAAALAPTGSAELARHLVHRYGTAWRDVWGLAERDPALARPVAAGLPYVRAELVHGVDEEMACTIADLLVRRTHVAFETRDAGRSAAATAAAVLAAAHGWSASRTERELDDFMADSARIFAIEP